MFQMNFDFQVECTVECTKVECTCVSLLVACVSLNWRTMALLGEIIKINLLL